MNKIKLPLFSSLIIILFLYSCNQYEYGHWQDNIHLSTKTAEFNATGDSIIITTKGSSWWINGIYVDEIKYLKFDGIDLLSDHYKITKDCFTVERRDLYTLSIKMDANPKSELRIMRITLEAGDYFDGITVTQKF